MPAKIAVLELTVVYEYRISREGCIGIVYLELRSSIGAAAKYD